MLPLVPALGAIRRIDDAFDAAKNGNDILVLGRMSGLDDLAKKEGGRLSTTTSKTTKEIYKQNSSDIRKANKIIFNERNVPKPLHEALEIKGGQYSRAERELILARPDLLEKTIFK